MNGKEGYYEKSWVLFFVSLALVFSTLTSFLGMNVSAESQYSYTIDSVKMKTLGGIEVDVIPDGGFCLEAIASINDNAEDADYLVFAIYGENGLIDVKFADDSAIQSNKLTFTAMIPELQEEVSLIKAFIWDEALKPLSSAGSLSFSNDSDSTNNAKVAPITGISFEKQGMYIKMTLEPPADETGIVSYEAVIYNKNNPSEAVHRSITLEGKYAYYRLDYPDIFTIGQEFNTVKVTSNGGEGYGSAVWVDDISIVPSQKDITVSNAWVVNANEIDITLAGVNQGYICAIFSRNDGTVITESYFNYGGGTIRYRTDLNEWSDADKTALENGEVSVSITGMNITNMSPTNGEWLVEFERIKAPKLQVQCDVDIVR